MQREIEEKTIKMPKKPPKKPNKKKVHRNSGKVQF